jgi:hypothetical protein
MPSSSSSSVPAIPAYSGAWGGAGCALPRAAGVGGCADVCVDKVAADDGDGACNAGAGAVPEVDATGAAASLSWTTNSMSLSIASSSSSMPASGCRGGWSTTAGGRSAPSTSEMPANPEDGRSSASGMPAIPEAGGDAYLGPRGALRADAMAKPDSWYGHAVTSPSSRCFSFSFGYPLSDVTSASRYLELTATRDAVGTSVPHVVVSRWNGK